MEKIVPGISDFKTVRENGYYYVDKSLFIEDVLEYCPHGTFMFSRPRGFGKSMNLSMLDAFLNVEYKGNTWFDGLAVSNRPELERYKNRFPVIYLELDDVVCDTYEDLIRSYSVCMERLYEAHSYLKDSDRLREHTKEHLEECRSKLGTEGGMIHALRELIMAVREHYGSDVVVLIDDYDNPTLAAYGKPADDDVWQFFRYLYTSVGKGNDRVQMCVFMGRTQYVERGPFSGLNNQIRNYITSERSDDKFGFTDDEVKAICADLGEPERFSDVKNWYGGYRFGNKDLFNPLGAMSFAGNGFRHATFWEDYLGTFLLDKFIKMDDSRLWDKIRLLLGGEVLHEYFDPIDSLYDLDSCPVCIYSLLGTLGYLRHTDEGLSIPNYRVRMEFSRMIFAHLGVYSDRVKVLLDSVISDDMVRLKDILHSIMDEYKEGLFKNEHNCMMFAVALQFCSVNYHVLYKTDEGLGLYAVHMKRIAGKGDNILIGVDSDGNDMKWKMLTKKVDVGGE